MITSNCPSLTINFSQSLIEQVATERKRGITQRTLSPSSKKTTRACNLLDRQPSFFLKSYTSKEGLLEIFYNERTREFHGVITNLKGGKIVVRPWDIEGLPKNLKQCTTAKMTAFFDQTHVHLARLSNGEYKVYLNVKGLGGTGPEDDFSCFLEAFSNQKNNKESDIGILLDDQCLTPDKGMDAILTEAVKEKVIDTDFEGQIKKFFTILSKRQDAVKEAITAILLSSTYLNEFSNHLNILDARFKALQKIYDKFGPIFVDKINKLSESPQEDSVSLDDLDEAENDSSATVQSLKTTVINQLGRIGSACTAKQKAFDNLDIREKLKNPESVLKNATLYEYFGEKLKAAGFVQATELHKKAIEEYEKYQTKLEDKTETESKIKKLKETVVQWHLDFAKKAEEHRHVCQALEEYEKYKAVCEKGWGSFAENVDGKIQELKCKKNLIYNAFEIALKEIASKTKRNGIEKKEDNSKCFIAYPWEKDVQTWINDNLAIDLKQAGLNVMLDIWGQVRPGDNPHTYMEQIGEVPYVTMVATPTYKDKWEKWKKKEAGTGVSIELNILMDHYNNLVIKQKGAVFVVTRKGNRNNSIPTFFRNLKSFDCSKDDDYFKNILEIAATFHKLENGVYSALLDSFEEEREAISQKSLKEEDYTEAETWFKDRIEKKKVIHLPDRTSTESVTQTVNAPAPNSDFVGRKEELSQLECFLKKGQYGTVALLSEAGVRTGKTEIAKRYFYEKLKDYAYALWISAKDPLPPQFKTIAERLALPLENKTPDEINHCVKEQLEKSANWLLVFDGAESQEALLSYLPQTGGHVIVTSRNQNWPNFHVIAIDVFNENDAVAFLRRIAALSHEREEYALRELALELDYLPASLQEAGNQMYRRYDAGAYRRYKEEELRANRRSLGEKSNLPEREEKFVGLERTLKTLEEKFETNNRVILTADTTLDNIHKKHIALQYAYRSAGKKYGLIWWFDATNSESILRGYEGLAKKLKLKGQIEVQLKEQGIKWLFIFDEATNQKALNPYLSEDKNIGGDMLITSKSQEWVDIEMLPVKTNFSSEKAVQYFCSMVKEDHYAFEQKAKELVEELKFFPLAIKQAAAYIVAAKTSVLEREVSIEEYFQLFKNEREHLLQTANFSPTNDYALIIRATLNIAVKKILAEEEKEKRTPIGFTLRLMKFCTQQEDDLPRASLKKWIGQNFGWENADFYEENALNRLEKYALITLTKDFVSVHPFVQEGVRNQFTEKDGVKILDITSEKSETNTPKVPSSYYNLPNENPYFVGRDAERKQLKDLLEQHGRVVLTSTSGVKIGKTEIAKKYLIDNIQAYTHIFWISAESKIPEKLAKKHFEKHAKWLVVFDSAKDKNSILPYLPSGHVIITSREQNWEGFPSIEINPLKKEDACTLLTQVSGQSYNHKIEELAAELDHLPEILREAGMRMRAAQEGVDWYRITTEERLAQNAVYLKERSNLPPRNEKFTGREFALQKLEETLQAKPNTPVVIAAETGLGGVGKTQIALQYAYRSVNARKKGYDLIWWFHAETPASITGEYESLAKRLGIIITEEDRKQNKVIERIVCYLRWKKTKWLFIFDNAEDQETLTPYLPSMGGDVIITSRNKNWKEIEKFEVTVFQPEESVRYFCKVVGREDADFKEEALKLAEALGHLPLALAQAAAYIAGTKIPVEEYTQRFLNRRKELWRFTDPPREDDYKLTVSVTWDITMKKIEEEEKSDVRFSKRPSSCALSLMNLCAYLAPNSIPSDWLKEWMEGEYEKKEASFYANKTIDRLFHYSMIDSTEKFISVHKLVQTVIQDGLSEKEREKFIREALGLVKEKFDSYDYADPKTWKVGRECFPHAVNVTGHILRKQHFLENENLKEILSTELSPEITDVEKTNFHEKIFYASEQGKTTLLFHQMAIYTVRQGNAFEAKEYYTQALEMTKAFLGENHPSVAETLNNLGTAWSSLGEKKKAIEYYKKVLEILKAILGASHPSVASTLNNLGNAWSSLGEKKKAIENYEKALEMKKSFLGESHPSVAETLNNLGNAWSSLGENKKAIEYYEKALEMTKAILGESHPSVAETLNNLGTAWSFLGEKQKAIEYYEKALEMKKSFLGESHPSVADTLNNLGNAWSDLGEKQKAIEYYEKALEMTKSFLGESHPSVAETLHNLGTAWSDLGEKKKAIEYYEKALEMTKSFLGASHPSVAYTLNNLGNAWSSLGEEKKAIEYYEKALEMTKSFLGESHPSVADTLNNLGTAWSDLGEKKKAIEYYEKALEMKKSFLGESHPSVADTLHNLGTAWSDLGENKKAIEYYEKALEMKKAILGESHPSVADTLHNLGTAWSDLGENKKAIEYYEKALEMKKSFLGESHPSVADTLNNLGTAWSSLGEEKKAIEYYEKALEMKKSFLGESHPSVVSTLHNLGTAWSSLGENKKAIEYYEKALEILKTFLGESHPSVAETLHNLGLAWSSLGENKKAIEYYEKALEILKAFFGAHHPSVASILNNLAYRYSALSQHQKAIESLKQAKHIYKTHLGKNHSDYINMLDSLAEIYNNAKEYSKSLLIAEKALKICEEVYKDGHWIVSSLLIQKGRAHYKQKQFQQAQEYQYKALTLAEKLTSNTYLSIQKGNALLALGKTQRAQHNPQASLTFLKKARDLFIQTDSPKHSDVAKCHHALGKTYEALQQPEEALDSYTQAYETAFSSLPEDHPDLLKYKESLKLNLTSSS